MHCYLKLNGSCGTCYSYEAQYIRLCLIKMRNKWEEEIVVWCSVV